MSTNKLLSLPSHTHLQRPVSVIKFILMETCWIRGGVGRLEEHLFGIALATEMQLRRE